MRLSGLLLLPASVLWHQKHEAHLSADTIFWPNPAGALVGTGPNFTEMMSFHDVSTESARGRVGVYLSAPLKLLLRVLT